MFLLKKTYKERVLKKTSSLSLQNPNTVFPSKNREGCLISSRISLVT